MADIHELLATAAGRVGAIDKTEKNKEQGFMFRSIDAIVAAAKPVFAELGISVTPKCLEKSYEEVTSSKGTRGWRCCVTMEYEFAAPDGSTRVASMPGEAIDYGDKSTTKAAQMAYKYALTEILLIGSGEADADAGSHDLEPTREDYQAPVSKWLGDAVQMFKDWNEEQRREQYLNAVKQLALTEVADLDTAKQVIEFMAGTYWEQFPESAGAPF